MSEMTNIQEQVFSLLNLSARNRTPKGWYMGGRCPRCGRDDKFGVKFNDDRSGEYKNHVVVHCFHGSCQFSGSENLLFKELGRDDLIQKYEYREGFSIQPKIRRKEEEIIKFEPLKKRYPPLGYRRVYSNQYLEGRGFTESDFENYKIGISNIDTKLKDYVIFLVEENFNVIGWIGRVCWSGERLKEENLRRKEKKLPPVPKYRNEGGVEFSETFYGIDEITDEVTTVILVEGILDKINVDRELKLQLQKDIKCLCTFGKKISEIQIEKLKSKSKNLKKIVLMYDPDAVESIKQYSYKLLFEFESVEIGKLTGEKDPGEMNKEELLLVLRSTETFLSYRTNTLNRRKL